MGHLGHNNSSLLHGPDYSEDRSSYATAKDRQSSHGTETEANTTDWRSSPVPADVSSASHSETTSFRKREAELQTIQARFGDALSRRKVPVTFQSKFKEDFLDSGPSHNPHSLLLSKIHIKNHKASAKHSHLFGNWSATSLYDPSHIQNASIVEGKRYFSARLRPDIDDTILEKPSKSLQSTVNHHIPWWERVIKSGESRKRVLGSDATNRAQFRNYQSLSKHHDAPPHKSESDSTLCPPGLDGSLPTVVEPPKKCGQPSQTTISRIDETPISIHYSGTVNKPLTSPSSWENYPSHLFKERNGPATIIDRVIPRDFAVDVAKSERKLHGIHDQQITTAMADNLADKCAL